MINKTQVNYKGLTDLLKEFDKQYSIKIGIIGNAAYQKHEGTDLTNAELGAAHEFGATIEIPSKDGASSHTVILPTRSFLRMPLLSSEGKKAIIAEIAQQKYSSYAKQLKKSSTSGYEEFISALNDKETDEASMLFKEKISEIAEKTTDVKSNTKGTITPKQIANIIALAALSRVQEAFSNDGFGNWKPTTAQSRKRRKGGYDNPTLVDTAQLRDSISAKVEEV